MTRLSRPWIMAVTDRRRLAPDARTVRDQIAALSSWVETTIAAGVDVIQIREGDLDAGAMVRVAVDAMNRASGTMTRVVVNDRADVAAASRADGVHLPAYGLPIRLVRTMGPSWLIGRSVHPGDPALGGESAADYLLFGTVFETASKQGQLPAGVDALRRTASEAPLPIVAIGGITLKNAPSVIEAGAAGIAAIGLFLRPSAIAATVAALRQIQAGFESSGASNPK